MLKHDIPLISILMVDGSFREHFHSLDYFGNQTLPADEYELIWVEYYDTVQPELAAKIAEHSNFRIVTLKRTGTYHSSYCFNQGIRESRGELLVIPDADIVVERDMLATLWNEHERNDELVMYCYRYDEPRAKHRTDWDIDYLKTVCLVPDPENRGPCLSVRRKWLLEVNGYEQHPYFATGFHMNAREVYTRFKNLGLAVKWHPTIKLYHPWHPQTSSGSYTYDVQRHIIAHREKSLETFPAEGIDSSKNKPLPPDLVSSTNEMVERIRRRQDGFIGKWSYLLQQGLQYLKGSLRYHGTRPHLPQEWFSQGSSK